MNDPLNHAHNYAYRSEGAEFFPVSDTEHLLGDNYDVITVKRQVQPYIRLDKSVVNYLK